MRTMMPNKIGRANRRPAAPLDAERECESASSDPPFLSAAVAHLCRWAPQRHDENRMHTNNLLSSTKRIGIDPPAVRGHRKKGQKANKKRMACVGGAYTVEPFVRTAEDVVEGG